MNNSLIKTIKSYEPLPSYLLAVVISIEIMLVFLKLGSFQDFNIEDLRYLLSALSQIEGTIMAIYVTITLVAIQLTPKEYFEVVFEDFRSKREFWAVIISYAASIIFTLLMLQNVSFIVERNTSRNFSWPFLICIFWGIFNLVILPLFLWNSFLMLNLKRSVIYNLLRSIMNPRERKKLFNIAYNAIQIPTVQTTTYILSEIWIYMISDFLEKLKELKDNVKNAVRPHLTEKDSQKVKEDIRFIRDIASNLKAIALKTIDQAKSGKITTNNALWVLNIISGIFEALLSALVVLLELLDFINSVPDVRKDLEQTLSKCISELESIMEELKKSPKEIREVELRRFVNSVPYNFSNKLEKMGHDDIAKRVIKLKNMAGEDKPKDSVNAINL